MKTIEKTRLCLWAAFRRTKRSGSPCPLGAGIAKGICLGLIVVSFTFHEAASAQNTAQLSNPDHSLFALQVAGSRLSAQRQAAGALHPKRANFGQERKSEQARQTADWVTDSGDNRGMPFAIVDKMDAKVFVFDSNGRLRGAAPVLLGLARGDYAVPGIGDRKLPDIRPEERTTAAGRFVASLGYNFNGKDVLWVDYKNAVSLHRVITNNPKERRLERLATPTPLDKRISYGCINVPANFFDNVVKPTFTRTCGIVYVLPETLPIGGIFKSYYDADLRWRTGKTAITDDRGRMSEDREKHSTGRKIVSTFF
ncbi:MAG TPA: hypothetical protein VEF34_09390 [Syntrophobacteraceae bacterium]|nr:hypothetical protein [Syntrophobacteraceae bacterium]